MFTVREELPSDVLAIREVNRAAFGGDEEANLVDTLRASCFVLSSHVAVAGEIVVGHILFSPLVIETAEGERAAAALAPMAVLPEWQRRGVGSALVQSGLDSCRRQAIGAVIVVGHPEYYPRFGFSAALARNLQSPYSELGDAWMALELTPSALEGVSGVVRYHEAFAAL